MMSGARSGRQKSRRVGGGAMLLERPPTPSYPV